MQFMLDKEKNLYLQFTNGIAIIGDSGSGKSELLKASIKQLLVDFKDTQNKIYYINNSESESLSSPNYKTIFGKDYIKELENTLFEVKDELTKRKKEFGEDGCFNIHMFENKNNVVVPKVLLMFDDINALDKAISEQAKQLIIYLAKSGKLYGISIVFCVNDISSSFVKELISVTKGKVTKRLSKAPSVFLFDVPYDVSITSGLKIKDFSYIDEKNDMDWTYILNN